MAKKPKTPWPHGEPVKICVACDGSGMNRTSRASLEASRRTSFSSEELKCSHCNGRGKVIDNPGSVLCKHQIATQECYLCRRSLSA